MSALPRGAPHVRELFSGKGKSGGSSMAAGQFEFDQKESRKSYDISGGGGTSSSSSKKKKRAPAPPSSGLGGYKPKILAVDTSTNVPVNRGESSSSSFTSTSPVRPPRPSKDRGNSSSSNNNNDYYNNNNNTNSVNHAGGRSSSRPFMMGDKDTPMMLQSHDAHDLDLGDHGDLDLNVQSLRLNSSDSVPLTLHSQGMPGRAGADGLGTENPLFRLHEDEEEELQQQQQRLSSGGSRGVRDSVISSDVVVVHNDAATTFNDVGGDDDVGRYSIDDDDSDIYDVPFGDEHHDAGDSLENGLMPHPHHGGIRNPASTALVNGGGAGRGGKGKGGEELDGVFIPAPDYDEEEKTMTFNEELDDDDDDDATTAATKTTTSPRRRRSQKVYKEYAGEDYSQYLSDEESGEPSLSPGGGGRSNSKKNKADSRRAKTEVKRSHYKKRESLPKGSGKKDGSNKAFSGASTLRDFTYADSKFGTITNIGKKRNSLPSLSQTTGEEAELFLNTESSYEQFLRMKNGEDVGDVFPEPPVEAPSVMVEASPPGMPARYTRTPANSKDTLWKKMTWRFKRQSRNSFDLS